MLLADKVSNNLERYAVVKFNNEIMDGNRLKRKGRK